MSGPFPGRRLPLHKHAPGFVVTLIFTLGLAACLEQAARPVYDGPAVAVGGLVFENRSTAAIVSIRLLAAESGNFVSCGIIAPGGVCASGFPQTDYRGEPVEVNWVQNGETWSTGSLNLEVSSELEAAGMAEVRVVILAPGSAGVELLPRRGGR